MTRKDENRAIVTDCGWIQCIKYASKTKMYEECTSAGYNGIQKFNDGTYGVMNDVIVTFYLKNGDIFSVDPCDIIHKKSELPKQADVAAILHEQEWGFTFWEEKPNMFRVYVTYDENGFIDEYRVEMENDTGIIYDNETMVLYSELPLTDDVDSCDIPDTNEEEKVSEIEADVTTLVKDYNKFNVSLDETGLKNAKTQLQQKIKQCEKQGHELQLAYVKENLFENELICGFVLNGIQKNIESHYSILKGTVFKLACILDKEASKFDDSVKTMEECHRILIKEYYYKNPEKCLYFIKVHKQIFVVIEKLKTYSEFDDVITEYDKLRESRDSA